MTTKSKTEATIETATGKATRRPETLRQSDLLIDELRQEAAELRLRFEGERAAAKVVVDAALAEAVTLRERVLSQDLERLVAEGRDAGKITAGFELSFRDMATKLGVDYARSHLAAMPVVIPRNVHQPAALADVRRWGDYTVAERSAMQEENPTLLFQLLAEHKRRGGQ